MTMNTTAASILESDGKRYASEAIRLDRQGSKGMAITYYQKAIESFMRLVKLDPNYELNRIYIQTAMQYQERVKLLQVGHVAESEDSEPEVFPSRPTVESPTSPTKQGEAPPQQKTAVYDQLLITEKPNVKWEDVSGLEVTKKALREAIIYPTMRSDLFPLGWPRGILLYGPPGCGKTLIAAAVATEINAAFYSVDAASIMSKWLGEAEKNVAKLFRAAREKTVNGQPSVVFIDEIDSLLGTRSQEVGGEIRMRNQILKEMDGLTDKNKNLPLYVIGATNKPWSLDKAFIRRFQKRIYVPIPDYEARNRMFQIYTKELNMEGVDLAVVTEKTQGYSGSDIRDIAQAAQLKVVSEFFEAGKATDKTAKPRAITMDDFQDVLNKRRPSVQAESLEIYTKYENMFKAE